MIRKLLLIVVLVILHASVAMGQKRLFRPALLDNCLKKASQSQHFRILYEDNPYYLRGDFDGDNKPDYVVEIKGQRTGRNGVLICTAKQESFVLGADNQGDHPFSDMPHDNFVAPDWDVVSREELVRWHQHHPDLPTPEGEGIAMIWEDGIAVIYWDGKAFRWVGSYEGN
jgi:hypothetical protein